MRKNTAIEKRLDKIEAQLARRSRGDMLLVLHDQVKADALEAEGHEVIRVVFVKPNGQYGGEPCPFPGEEAVQ